MTPNTVGRSWITKPRWQFIAGTLIAGFILGAFLFAASGIRSERDQRQTAFNIESVKRDKEIKEETHNSEVRITCGFLKGIDRLTPQVPLNGTEDAATAQRINDTNKIRSEVRLILRTELPKDIVKECPPATD